MSTLQTIAAKAGVSKVTVHKVIHGKPGVSEKTRRKVMAIVDGCGYAINHAAASLKRDTLRLAVLYLELSPERNYFHRQVARGIDQAEEALAPFKVELLRLVCDDTYESQAEALDAVMAEDRIDGVVMYCNHDSAHSGRLALLAEKDVPVVTFHADAVDSPRLACVTASDHRLGRLAAECIHRMVHGSGHVVVLGGNKSLTPLRENVAGFYAYMREYRPDLALLELNDFDHIARLMDEVRQVCGALGDVRAVYSNSARNSPSLCETIKQMGAERLTVITTDVFPELRPYLLDGTIDATMWQDPESQSRNAIMVMYQYLTTRQFSPALCSIPIGVVMSSNVDDYCF